MRCKVCNAGQCKCNANVNAKVSAAKDVDAAENDDDVGLLCNARKVKCKGNAKEEC